MARSLIGVALAAAVVLYLGGCGTMRDTLGDPPEAKEKADPPRYFERSHIVVPSGDKNVTFDRIHTGIE